MARKVTPNLPFDQLKKACIEKGITSWPDYQKRYTEIAGAKKTLHATYAKEWKGNKAFFGNGAVATVKDEPVNKEAAKENAKKESKKVVAPKTASNSHKKAVAPKAAAAK